MRVLALPAFKFIDNPYVVQLYRHVESLGVKVDEFAPHRAALGLAKIWHLHWPDYFLNDTSITRAVIRSAALLALIDLAHLRGKKVIWTVHNIATHERLHPRIEERFWRQFIPRIDAYISLTWSGKSAALERFPALASKPGFVVPHGHYKELYPDGVSREAARLSLSIGDQTPVILFLGAIRPYKNVPALIQSFRQTRNHDKVLLVAGKCGSEADAADVRRAQGGDPRVRLFLDFVPADQVQRFMHAADLVILPFREILNSGSALLALSFGKPILVPNKGALSELRSVVGGQWVMNYQGDLTPNLIKEGLAWALQPGRDKMPVLDAFDWPHIAAQTVSAYKEICQASP